MKASFVLFSGSILDIFVFVVVRARVLTFLLPVCFLLL